MILGFLSFFSNDAHIASKEPSNLELRLGCHVPLHGSLILEELNPILQFRVLKSGLGSTVYQNIEVKIQSL